MKCASLEGETVAAADRGGLRACTALDFGRTSVAYRLLAFPLAGGASTFFACCGSFQSIRPILRGSSIPVANRDPLPS